MTKVITKIRNPVFFFRFRFQSFGTKKLECTENKKLLFAEEFKDGKIFHLSQEFPVVGLLLNGEGTEYIPLTNRVRGPYCK